MSLAFIIIIHAITSAYLDEKDESVSSAWILPQQYLSGNIALGMKIPCSYRLVIDSALSKS